MSIKYRSVKFILNYRDEKPKVFQLCHLRNNVISDKEIIYYAAKAAHVPESTIQMAEEALFDAINYFCTNGHAVQVPGIGTFGLQFKTKTAKTEEDVTEENINRKYIRFWAKHDIRKLCNMDNINVEVKDILKLKED
jgi:nucleoid DNA-binding protein